VSASISLELDDDGIIVIITTSTGMSRCTIDSEGARDLASALGLAGDILDKRSKRPDLRVVKDQGESRNPLKSL
jgi:hypothetical protein